MNTSNEVRNPSCDRTFFLLAVKAEEVEDVEEEEVEEVEEVEEEEDKDLQIGKCSV